MINAQGVGDPQPDRRTITVQEAGGSPEVLPQAGWSLVYVGSEELSGEDGRGVNAFDGDPETFWVTEWSERTVPFPHEIQIDLGAVYTLDALHYLPWQGGEPKGRIQNYAVYLSGNGVDWGEPVALGSFADTVAEQSILFSPTVGRFVRFVALTGTNSDSSTAVAEVKVEGQCDTIKLSIPLYQVFLHPPSSTIYRLLPGVLWLGNYLLICLCVAVIIPASAKISEWDCSYPLLIGNELTQDRPWQGKIRSYFQAHRDEFSDDLHPNGIGYQSMAELWFNSLR